MLISLENLCLAPELLLGHKIQGEGKGDNGAIKLTEKNI